jgi:hypothetical protein
MAELIQEWLPYLLGLLITCGGAAWLRSTLKDLGLVKKLHAEGLVDSFADRLVRWAENKTSGAGKGGEKFMAVKERLKTKLGAEGVNATDDELEEAIEAAHRRMRPFPTNSADTPTSG